MYEASKLVYKEIFSENSRIKLLILDLSDSNLWYDINFRINIVKTFGSQYLTQYLDFWEEQFAIKS